VKNLFTSIGLDAESFEDQQVNQINRRQQIVLYKTLSFIILLRHQENMH